MTSPRTRLLFARVSAVLLGVLLATGASFTFTETVASPTCADASSWDTGSESEFVRPINQTRSERGIPPLTVDPVLVDNARNWIGPMISNGQIYHASDLSIGISAETGWDLLGENVGVGGSTSDLYPAFVASPTHLENIVNPAYERVGVGVFFDGQRMWTVQRYMSVAEAPPVTGPPSTAAPLVPAPAATSATAPGSTSAPAAPPTSTAPTTSTTMAPPPETTAPSTSAPAQTAAPTSLAKNQPEASTSVVEPAGPTC